VFLISYYLTNSLNPNATSHTNFFKNKNNFVQDEHIEILYKLNLNQLKQADVVLNLSKHRVEKCRDYGRFASSSYDDIFAYFYNIYPNELNKAICLIKKNEK
jgi:hypothetical protein